MTEPILRRVRPEDAGFLSDLAGEAFATYGDYRGMVETLAADPHVEVTLAEHEGAPVGAAFLVFEQADEAPDTKVGNLLALAVAAPHRRHGIGRALVAHVVARARDVASRHDIAALRLLVAETNTAARRLFESVGFVYYDAHDDSEDSYSGGQKALHMRMPLPGRRPGAG